MFLLNIQIECLMMSSMDYRIIKIEDQMENYKILGKIGSGAYSNVLKAVQVSSGVIVALKEIEIPPDETMQNRVYGREIRTLQILGGHPNIIKLIQVFKQRNLIYLVFQYIPMDLITFYKAVKEKEKRNLNDNEITHIFRQVCSALEYMHSKRIIHRDIKPENILIDPVSLRVKLIDFGFSKPLVEKEVNTEYIVTRWYRPIEVVLGLPYDFKLDIFSIGALLLELYTGKEVFRSASNIDQLYWICFICGYPYWQPALDKIKKLNLNINPQSGSGAIIKSLIRTIRPQAQDLIIKMLEIAPHHRPSIFEVLDHPYFANSLKQPKKDNNTTVNNTNKRTFSQYQKRISQNNKNPPVNKVEGNNVLQQKKQSSISAIRTIKQKRKTQAEKGKNDEENHSNILRKEQSKNGQNSIINKQMKFGINKPLLSDKKIQISSLINKSLVFKHKRTQSGEVNKQGLQIGSSSRLSTNNSVSRNDFAFSKKIKPLGQSITQRKLHRMSNI